MDTRADQLAAETEAKIGAERIFAVSGNPFKPSYVTPKLLYLQKNPPELILKTDKILGSNAFIAYRLTGAVTHDYSQGYAWHFFNEAKLEYDYDLARDLEIESVYCRNLYLQMLSLGRLQSLLPHRPDLSRGHL
jgi:xylulokinase